MAKTPKNAYNWKMPESLPSTDIAGLFRVDVSFDHIANGYKAQIVGLKTFTVKGRFETPAIALEKGNKMALNLLVQWINDTRNIK